MRHNVCLNITKLLRSPHKHPELRTLGTVYCREEFEYDIAVTMTLFFSTGVHGVRTPPERRGKGEREGVGRRGKERGKGGKEGGHSLIFTWIDATVL